MKSPLADLETMKNQAIEKLSQKEGLSKAERRRLTLKIQKAAKRYSLHISQSWIQATVEIIDQYFKQLQTTPPPSPKYVKRELDNLQDRIQNSKKTFENVLNVPCLNYHAETFDPDTESEDESNLQPLYPPKFEEQLRLLIDELNRMERIVFLAQENCPQGKRQSPKQRKGPIKSFIVAMEKAVSEISNYPKTQYLGQPFSSFLFDLTKIANTVLKHDLPADIGLKTAIQEMYIIEHSSPSHDSNTPSHRRTMREKRPKDEIFTTPADKKYPS